jgi:hypothetical protein
MLSTRSFGLSCSGRFSSTVNFATSASIYLTLVLFVCCLFATPSHSQSLSIGTVATNGNPVACNPGAGFYYYNYPNQGLSVMSICQSATVNGCSQTINGQTVPVADSWPVTIGYLNPVGIVSGVTVAKGLIILHGGGPGTAPESNTLADNYFRAGFEVVQVVWGDDWEMVSDPIPAGTYGNIQAAACRPATVFNWAFNNLFVPNILANNSRAGMCALGDSAGSAAVAYSLAYYNAGSYLDNVELLSGPVFSDVEQGCQWKPQASSVQVCGLTNYNGTQYGCKLGGGSTWTLNPTYLSGANGSVAKWTNDYSCADANAANQSTTQASETQWLLQSLVDQSNITGLGATPTFTYSNTGVSAWLCRSVTPNPNYPCAANNNNNYNSCPNNSSPQGQLFYKYITSNSPPANYAVYAVDGCSNAESVGSGTVPGFYPLSFGGTATGGGNAVGIAAITDDMIGVQSLQIPPQCVRRSH